MRYLYYQVIESAMYTSPHILTRYTSPRYPYGWFFYLSYEKLRMNGHDIPLPSNIYLREIRDILNILLIVL